MDPINEKIAAFDIENGSNSGFRHSVNDNNNPIDISSCPAINNYISDDGEGPPSSTETASGDSSAVEDVANQPQQHQPQQRLRSSQQRQQRGSRQRGGGSSQLQLPSGEFINLPSDLVDVVYSEDQWTPAPPPTALVTATTSGTYNSNFCATNGNRDGQPVVAMAKRVTNRSTLWALAVILGIIVIAVIIVLAIGIQREKDTITGGDDESTNLSNVQTPTSAPTSGVFLEGDLVVDDSTQWIPLGAPIYGERGKSNFGSAIDMSEDGSVLVVAELSRRIGVYRKVVVKEPATTTGVDSENGDGNGMLSSAPVVTWKTFGNVTGMTHLESRVRTSTSISSDGTMVAMGSGLLGGNSFGNVVVYRYAENAANWSTVAIDNGEVDGGAWIQVGRNLTSTSPGEGFGHSISLSNDGTVLAIGAIQNDNENGSNAGHVQVFGLSNGDGENEWTKLGHSILGDGPGDNLGASVVLSGDGMRVAVGALGAISNSGKNRRTGQARVHDYNGTHWNQIGQTLYGLRDGEEFSYAMDMSNDGNILVVGSWLSDNQLGSEVGRVRVYQLTENEESVQTWSRMGSDLFGEAVGRRFGSSVSLSRDGKKLAVGAVGGTGHVRVFRYDGSHWIQSGQPIQGAKENDRAGAGTALSGDGSILAIGATSGSITATHQGEVRIFQAFPGEE